jgi:hypothetical protein
MRRAAEREPEGVVDAPPRVRPRGLRHAARESVGLIQGERAVEHRERLQDDGRARPARAVVGDGGLVEEVQLRQVIVAASEQVEAAPELMARGRQLRDVHLDPAVGVGLQRDRRAEQAAIERAARCEDAIPDDLGFEPTKRHAP